MSLSAARLQRLLAYRERRERLQQQELAAALRAHGERERRLADARHEREAALAGAPQPNATDAASAIDFLQRVAREIATGEAALAHSQTLVERERETLRTRSGERKAMEILLARREAEERAARSRAETQQLNEIGARRWFDAHRSQTATEEGTDERQPARR